MRTSPRHDRQLEYGAACRKHEDREGDVVGRPDLNVVGRVVVMHEKAKSRGQRHPITEPDTDGEQHAREDGEPADRALSARVERRR
jgi:hypothetical protein